MKQKKTILALNVGSSSIKYSLFQDEECIFSGEEEKVFTKKQRYSSLSKIFSELEKRKIKPDAVVHRVVHGKDFRQPEIIDTMLIKKLNKIAELAPLHEIPEVQAIEFCKERLEAENKNSEKKKAVQAAVFDTSFYADMPEKNSIYGIPYRFYKKGIRKYGFHGISHKYVTNEIKEFMNGKGKVISCHLGNGSSVTAVVNGKAIDTSMGFTPLEGLVMGTRSGSIDPAIIPYLIKYEKMSIAEISSMLNNESGLLGISGLSRDMRTLLENKEKDRKAKLAVEVFIDRVVKQIGSFAAMMNGVDAIIFTGGIGEHNPYIRNEISKNLLFLGVKIDGKMNNNLNFNKKIQISSKSSKVKIFAVKTDEMLEMIIEAKSII